MHGHSISPKYLFLPAGILLLTLGCGGGGNGGQNQNGGNGTVIPPGNKVTLSGRFATAPAVAPTTGTANAAPATTVSTVVIFDTNGNYSTAPVVNGAFSIPVDSTAPVAMIFAGSANNFLGYMTLGNGINSLPLTILKDGTTSIDLQTLTASGSGFIPGHNPLGSELPLSVQEQSAFAQCNSIFSSDFL